MPPGVNPYIKDIFEMAAWTVAVVGGGVAAFSAIFEMRSNTRQRFAELRWRRASAAKDLLHEIHCHAKASCAVTMLDWCEGTHEYDLDEGKIEVTYEDVLRSLGKPQAQCGKGGETYITDCFDWLFYFIDRIEHYIRGGLIDFEDVSAVFRPYAKRVAKQRDVFFGFMCARGYESAMQFWERYGSFEPVTQEQPGSVASAPSSVDRAANPAPGPDC